MTNSRSTVWRLLDVLDYLVDERVGIIHSVKQTPRLAGDPDFFHFAARPSNARVFSRQGNFPGAGASADPDLGAAKAVGEAVERYCSAIYDFEDFPLTSADAAPFPVAPPSDFATWSGEQYARPGFQFVPFEDSTPVRWTSATDAATGDTCYVPAAMVFIPYMFYAGSGEAPIWQPISTGLACHCSFEEAAATAICEVIERDCFTITWQARLSLPQLRNETLSDKNYDLVQRFEVTGNAITLLDISLDIDVPTILAVLRNSHPDAAPIVFAAAADLDPEEAVRKSLEELEHTRQYSQHMKTHFPRLTAVPDFENVQTQFDHLNFWCDSANVPLADFIFDSEARIDFQDIADRATGHPGRDLAILVEKVSAVGRRVLLSDVTSDDVRDLGIVVVRAVIPGLHPLRVGHDVRSLGGRRLWEIPQMLGYPGITLESGDNPIPHPYP